MALAHAIREWREEDFEAMHAMDAACFPPRIAYSRRTLQRFLRLPEAECLVAEIDGGLAAFILTASNGRFGHIITLDVGAEFRRHGLGSALVVEAERRLAARGVEEVELETAVDNKTAVAFWLRCGYSPVGVLRNYYGRKTDAYYMTRSLKSALKRAKAGGQGRQPSRISQNESAETARDSQEKDVTCSSTKR